MLRQKGEATLSPSPTGFRCVLGRSQAIEVKAPSNRGFPVARYRYVTVDITVRLALALRSKRRPLSREDSKMAAARTTHKGIYASDILAQNFLRRVDDHLFTQTAALGWAVPIGGELPMPGTLRPRHGVGKDASGRSHSVVVADTTADLWTRTTLQWNVLDDVGALTAVTLTGLVGEAVTF